MDWGLLEMEGVRGAIETAARRVSREWIRMDVDDLVQEGLVIVATRGNDARIIMDEGGIGRLNHWVWCNLWRHARSEYRKMGIYQNPAEPAVVEPKERDEPAPPPMLRRTNLYDRRLVELLLASMWNCAPGYGMVRENELDPQMPRSKSNPAHGNTVWAMLADIQKAWDKTPLTHDERCALVLRFGLDWTEDEIGANQGVDQSTASRRIKSGVNRVVNWLNKCDRVQVCVTRIEEDK